ncbi:MAG: DUF3572 domain-containing protein [Pseudomonadota bacterium]|nr:DUF3572 domain-containing protein [Pseudomonadota bacterium]MEE3099504.1 DUF3572 domain-containing protein [Pseudomonadota bacterium]
MTQDAAERIGIGALGHLAGDPDVLGAFLAAAGADPAELRARAAEPEFLGFVLDFLLADEPLLIGYCDAAGLPYDAPMRARAALPGGAVPDWT